MEEEDIKILEEYIDTDYGALKIWQINELNKCEDLRQAIENLLKAYKQDEKMIDLMAKQINDLDFNFNIDCFIPKEYVSNNDCAEKENCIDCIKEYFRKKIENE